MINRIQSDLPTFKEICFKPGFNILLSRKTAESADRETMNRAGKSSLVKIIHFLLGAEAPKDSIFKSEAISRFEFGMDVSFDESTMHVSKRGNDEPSRIYVAGSSNPVLNQLLRKPSKPGVPYVTPGAWRAFLGEQVFGLDVDTSGRNTKIHGPTFRMLFPYFAREEDAGGFRSPTEYSVRRQPWQQQVAISFLLGLEWGIASEFELVHDNEKGLNQASRTVASESLGFIIGSAAELRSRLTILEDQCSKAKENLNGFNVLPEYRSLEIEASDVTQKIAALADENTMDRLLCDDINNTLSSEKEPDIIKLRALFAETDLMLSDLISRRYDEVLAFHRSVVANRRAYVEGELERARKRITVRDEKKQGLAARLSEIMRTLESRGALDQFQSLQRELTKKESLVEDLRRQLETIKKIEMKKDEYTDQRRNLKRRLDRDFEERSDVLKRAVLEFQDVSSALYSQPGSFTYEATDRGPVFRVNIQGQKSLGITHMQVFCFDMMLMRMCSERGIGPGFLVHDSHIFDGVDGRQVIKALEYASKATTSSGFQYIVTMNEDDYLKASVLSPDLDLAEYILPVDLTDETDDGGLFGFRFA
jgi:uncharacterized protein YydD (DUF2326 family)